MPIIEATFVASTARDHSYARLIEEAMSKAISEALSEGISDPAVIKARLLLARQQLKDN